MTCCNCNLRCKKFGKFGPQKIQRYRCNACKKTFSEEHEKQQGPLGEMRISLDKAEMCLKLMLEVCRSVPFSASPVYIHETILNLLVLAGKRCERLMQERIKDVPVKDVEADEMWGFVQMKNRAKLYRKLDDPTVGDAYTFVGIERNSKLILAWHLGQRDMPNTEAFTEKLHYATSGEFQLTTDGWGPYVPAVSYSLGTRVDFAQLIKVYANNREGEQKYSPLEVEGIIVKPQIGSPDPRRVCTSIVERSNLSIRTSVRRLTRLTNAFSKSGRIYTRP